ncbi:MAG: DotU family type IV/VI secretion system protein [Proteobacteria bacterium]|nr:DotU family type IV/VI secretion system protein [Pseudomonadota bacterium]
MPRLLDCFSPLIALGLKADTATGPTSALRQQVLGLLIDARIRAGDAGYAPGTVESAVFAMVAWIDEVLTRRSAAGEEAYEPLQLQLFNSRNAHTEFFHHLSALQPQDDELREVYWNAMALGFAGQYYFETDDTGELGKLKALHGRQLANPPLDLPELAHERITPQPYAAPDPPLPGNPLARERAVLWGGGVLALLLPVLVLAWLSLMGPRETPAPLAQHIDQQLQRYACSDLSSQVGPDGRVTVQGFVSKPEDMEAVRREVGAMPGVRAPQFRLGLRIWPHCEVYAILKPYQARNRDKNYGLRIRAPTAVEGRLREGDTVVLRLTQASFDANLWVDYYTADGSVLHFQAGRGQLRVPADAQIELGRDIPASWLVSPPFGTVMVAAIASPAPFSETADRPPFELASAYLLRLREMLAANRGADRLVADILFLETVER